MGSSVLACGREGGVGQASSSGAGAGSVAVAGTGGATAGTGGGRSAAAGTGVPGAAGSGRGGTGTGTAGSAAGGGASGSAGGGTAGSAGAPGGAGANAAGSAGANAAGSAGAAAPEECAGEAQPMPERVMLSGDLGTHDPTLIEAEGTYYLFNTGRGIPTKTSTDLKSWRDGRPVFSQNPGWIAQQVDGATDLWAPDISFFGDQFHLYYSASTFGSNQSCIGHATRASLSSGEWMDQGPVVCSNDGTRDDWNAIDPNAVLDEQGKAWLSFGSFWSGIKLIELDAQGARQGDSLVALASRTDNDRAIEAPVIKHRCDYYYLFASFDACCRGADSTYKLMVGRSRELVGPYEDRTGKAMLEGGGSMLVSGDMSWKGPGHNAVIQTTEGWFNAYHAYAASDGRATLRISELAWDSDGWPVSGGP